MATAILDSFNINTFPTDGNKHILEMMNKANIDGYELFNALNLAKRENTMYDSELANRQRMGQHFSIFNGGHTFGNSQTLTPNTEKQTYSYSVGMDYYANFAGKVGAAPKTTEVGYTTPKGLQRNYVDLYLQKNNLYPNELNSSEIRNEWSKDVNMYSLLSKTKELFNQNKINTIISSFHTNNHQNLGEDTVSGVGPTEVGSSFGLSHGRNLLTKNAEDNGIGELINGYDNPYCRVWTHHYQYDRLDKLIRPFFDSESGECRRLIDLHTWTKNFIPEEFVTEKNEETGKERESPDDLGSVSKLSNKYHGWKNRNERWNKSVLGKNGFVNITPKFGRGGAESIHTKQCMFSIENLAWKDMCPFEFEKNLSWEQRGPMGGRIMWFPPYGITFQETTNAQWQASQFIGRGEDVYTYINTKRSGSLSFMMVVDHPSVTDYATWYRNGAQDYDSMKDTDWLRFFAGCDSGDGLGLWKGGNGNDLNRDFSSAISFTTPPPLTSHEGKRAVVPEQPNAEYNPDGVISPEHITETNPIEIVFYVFFPNNYSGLYDYPTVEDSQVNFAAYLINGVGTNKTIESGNKLEGEPNNPIKPTVNDILNTKDIKIDVDTFGHLSLGYGYEIYKNRLVGIGIEGDDFNPTRKNWDTGEPLYAPIYGTVKAWWKYSELPSVYPVDYTKRYHYRVDGEYSVPQKESPAMYQNTYDDQFSDIKNYQDNSTWGLNSSNGISIVNERLEHIEGELDDVNGDKILCSFTEIIAALHYDEYADNFIERKICRKNVVDRLHDIFENNIILEVCGYGGASGHGEKSSDTQATKSNQSSLCKNRYNSVVNLLRKYDNIFGENVKYSDYQEDVQEALSHRDPSHLDAKLGRYAKIIIKAENTEVSDVSDNLATVDNTVADTYNSSSSSNATEKTDEESLRARLYSGDVSLKSVNIQFEYKDETRDLNITDKKITLKYNDGTLKDLSITPPDAPIARINVSGDDTSSDEDGRYVGITLRKGDPTRAAIIYENGITNDIVKKIVTYEFNGGGEDDYLYVDFVPKDDGYYIELYSPYYQQVNNIRGKITSVSGFEFDDDMNPVENNTNISTQQTIQENRTDGTNVDVKKNRNRNTKYNSDYNLNWIRYDQEYRFFKELESKNPIVFNNLMQKLQYFDPAFHSMTPEGFNARLAFLHQCTRQGATLNSSQNGMAANLAFGRPPFCILRLGDFYNQMIVIESINIAYDSDGGVQWDLNPEGTGVQPLLAKISINFNFVGGGDMYGPIRRLQNAVSFNYYANQGLYDNRADYEIRYWDAEKADAYHTDDNEYVTDGVYHHTTQIDKRIRPTNN